MDGKEIMLDTGIKGYQELTVAKEDTAKLHKSGTLDVLATPRMVAFSPGQSPPAVKIPTLCAMIIPP